MMPEREILTRMGVKGLKNCFEAVADLLESMNYHDSARTLRNRWDEYNQWGGDDD